MLKKAVFAGLGAVLVSACSPYVYNKEITTFATGVDTVVLTHQTGEQAIATQIAQQQQTAHLAAKGRLNLSDGCDAVDPKGDPPKLEDCSVVSFGVTKSAPLPLQVHLANDEPLFAALKAYSAALAAISNATDSATLTQATQTFTAAAGGLAGAISKVDPTAPSSAVVTSVGGFLGQGISIYLDSRRYAVLRSIVPALDPAIATLGKTVEADLYAIRANQVRQLQLDLHADVAPLQVVNVGNLSQSDYQTKYTALQAKITTFNQARAADPKAVAIEMVNAHHQLAMALQSGTEQIVPIMTAVTNFATAAETMRTAVDASAVPVPAKK